MPRSSGARRCACRPRRWARPRAWRWTRAANRLLIANGDSVTEWALQAGGATIARKLAWDARPQEVNLIAYSPDGRLVAAATDQGVALWSGPDDAKPLHLSGTEAILRFSFSADSRMLGAISTDGNLVKVWSVPDGELLLSYRPQDESGDKDIFSVIFSAGSDKFFAVEAPDPKTGVMRLFVHGIVGRRIDPKPTLVPMKACPQLDFSYAAGGNRVGLSLNAKVCTFDVRRLAEGDEAAGSTPTSDAGEVTDIAISPDGRFVVRMLGRINEIQVANLSTGELWRLQGAFDLASSTSYEGRMAISSNGERLAIKARDGSIRIFDLAEAGGSAVTSRWISPDEKLVVVPATDGLHEFFELRDFETQKVLRQLDPEGRFKSIRDFVLSADGKQLYARGQRPNDEKPLSLLGFDVASNAPPVEHRVDDILAWDHDLFLVQEAAEWLLYLGTAKDPVFRMASPTGSEVTSRRMPKTDSLQFGNKRLFAVQTYAPDAIRVRIFGLEGAEPKLLRTIERPPTERVDIAFQGGGRVLLLSNGKRTEVWDVKSAAGGPAFLLTDVLPRNVFVGIDSNLVIVRRDRQALGGARPDGRRHGARDPEPRLPRRCVGQLCLGGTAQRPRHPGQEPHEPRRPAAGHRGRGCAARIQPQRRGAGGEDRAREPAAHLPPAFDHPRLRGGHDGLRGVAPDRERQLHPVRRRAPDPDRRRRPGSGGAQAHQAQHRRQRPLPRPRGRGGLRASARRRAYCRFHVALTFTEPLASPLVRQGTPASPLKPRLSSMLHCSGWVASSPSRIGRRIEPSRLRMSWPMSRTLSGDHAALDGAALDQAGAPRRRVFAVDLHRDEGAVDQDFANRHVVLPRVGWVCWWCDFSRATRSPGLRLEFDTPAATTRHARS